MHAGKHVHAAQQTNPREETISVIQIPTTSTQKLAADSSCDQTTSCSWSQASPSGPAENMLKALSSDCFAIAEGKEFGMRLQVGQEGRGCGKRAWEEQSCCHQVQARRSHQHKRRDHQQAGSKLRAWP